MNIHDLQISISYILRYTVFFSEDMNRKIRGVEWEQKLGLPNKSPETKF
jgi:hypothetical protein